FSLLFHHKYCPSLKIHTHIKHIILFLFIRVSAGEDVILNCEVEPDIDLTKKTVEWKYFDTSTKKELWVHMFRNGKDDPDSQDDKFKKRTFLFHDKLKEGNLSLKLLSVNLSDEGIYTCIVNNC
uniref:Ig-like domain-containing protein n=1 Tax=Echeneis naucrates TaxID=173247 RepID=A0A665TP06_ECHNA